MNRFATIPATSVPRAAFDRSCTVKTTLDTGYLQPFLCEEIIPGDVFNTHARIFARMATPIVPIMDNLYMDTFYFFVPSRIIFENWEKLNGAQDNPGDSTDYLTPVINAPDGGFPELSIYDFFGVPTKVKGDPISAMPLRAYNKIVNDWFRDQNLVDQLPVHTGDGPDPVDSYSLFRRGKRHDYFTSCLPWPQKGAAVTLPLGSTAPVLAPTSGTTGAQRMRRKSDGSLVASASQTSFQTNAGAEVVLQPATGLAYYDPGTDGLYADLSQATAATINAIREAATVQQLLERDARGGTRYTEILRSHFGVISPDFRLQRAEYLGGGSTRINVHPVAQTAPTNEESPQGNLAGFGTAAINSHAFSKGFVEHGYVIGLMCVRADYTYQQGLDRHWSKRSRLDYYWPTFANLGEQAVLNKEIYYSSDLTENAKAFGFNERYAEYRFKPSQITGRFRSNATGTLDIWHLSKYFTSRPALNETFISEDPPIERVIATPTEPDFLVDVALTTRAVRPLPIFGIPGITRL